MLLKVDDVLKAFVIPTGECTCRFPNIDFRVIADTHCEKLHELSRKVLVRRALEVHTSIEVSQHRGILRHRNQQITEVASRLRAKQFILLQHFAVIQNLLIAGRKMPMPEERHLFLERLFRGQHAIGPPIANTLGLELGHALPIQVTICDLLKFAVTRRLGLYSECLTACLSQVGCGGSGGCERLQAWIKCTGIFKGWQGIFYCAVIHQRAHCLLWRHRCQLGKLRRCAAKARALQQMRCAIPIPFGRR